MKYMMLFVVRQNARAGLKTAFCKVGGEVCGIKIKASKIRGYKILWYVLFCKRTGNL